MRVAVPVKTVPDLVEELELTPDGTDIDREFLKFELNEFDDFALEEALLVKEAGGGEVVVIGLADDPDIEQLLYTALAKGADTAVALSGATGTSTHERAAAFSAYLRDHPVDVVITGVQASDDLDGQLAPTLAAMLGQPHVSVVVSVEPADTGVRVRQEFGGGRSADLHVRTPAVIGLQAARQAPRYVPITRIRQATQAGGLEQVSVAPQAGPAALTVRRMFPPEQTEHAEMLAGDADDVAEKIVELLRARGLVKG